MKTFKILSFVAGILALIALSACEEKVEDPFIKIEGQKDFNLTEAQQTVSVQVLSNRDWGVRMGEKASDWIVVEPSSGKASAKAVDVTITVLANTGTNRETAIEFYTGTATDMISVKQAGPGGDATPKPSGEGTLESPYNVAAACLAVKDLKWEDNTTYDKVGPYYVKGKISAIKQDYTYNVSNGLSYGNARFSISDDGTTTSDQFTLFNLYYLGNKKYVAGQTDIKVGDEVVIYAELMNYMNNTPENVTSGSYLYSLNGETGGGTTPEVPTGNPEGDGSEASPYNVAAALKATTNLSWTADDNYQKVGPYYVKGKISQIGKDKNGADLTYTQSGTFSNATFYISDDGSTSNEFYCYRLSYLGNQTFSSEMTDIKVGDEVVIYAELMNYRNNTPETVNKSGYLYSLNGETGSITPVETITGTVAETIAAADNSGVVIPEATIMAKSKTGLVVADESGAVYLYFNSNETMPDVAVGDKVKVEATKKSYGGVPEFTSANVTKLFAGEVIYPEPKDITPLASEYAPSATEYVKMTGVLKLSGNYVNVEIDNLDPSVKKGSVSQPLDALGVSAFDGQRVTVTGYFTGISTSKEGVSYVNIVATGIALADPDAKYCTVSPASLKAKADETSATFEIKSNAAWTVASDNTDFVIDPASGEGNATITVSFTANEGDEVRVANLTVVCADAGVEASVTVTQAKAAGDEEHPFTSNVNWTLDKNAYDQTSTGSSAQTGTINGITVDKMLKLGKSGENGKATITIPSGTNKLGFFALGWSGTNAKLIVTCGSSTETYSIIANAGVVGKIGDQSFPPYVITTSEEEAYYEFSIPDPSATSVKLESDGRVVLWGINAIK